MPGEQRNADRALVVGFGNALRGDDGVGPHAAARLAARALAGVRVLVVHQLTPELAADLAAVRQAVFVDAAAHPGAEPVAITRLEAGGGGPGLTHTGDPRALLGLAQVLYGRAPDAWLVTVAGECFRPREGLTDAARRHAHLAVETVESLLRAARLEGANNGR